MSNNHTKVMGYFAYRTKVDVVCSDTACIIAGSEERMKKYISELFPGKEEEITIRKTRFGEILNGLNVGAAYAFDRESYGRFYPIARTEGLAIEKMDFEEQDKISNRFLTVEIVFDDS